MSHGNTSSAAMLPGGANVLANCSVTATRPTGHSLFSSFMLCGKCCVHKSKVSKVSTCFVYFLHELNECIKAQRYINLRKSVKTINLLDKQFKEEEN